MLRHGPARSTSSAWGSSPPGSSVSRKGGIDAVLLDLQLPDSEGIVTFERTYAFAPDVPIVVLTEMDDEEVAIATVQGGAQDYLVKGEVSPAIVVKSIRSAVERRRFLSALRSLSLSVRSATGRRRRPPRRPP